MGKLKAIGSFVLTLLLVAASIAQILSWLEIKPKELPLLLTALRPNQWVVLLIAFLFIVAALSVSGYSLYLSFRVTDRLRNEIAERKMEWLNNTNHLVGQIASKQLEIDEMSLRHQRELRTLQVRPPSKLKIHSALWGTGPENDVEVGPMLQELERDGLVIPVTREFLQYDPIQGPDKRLEVQYSYGNPTVLKTTRPEYSRLVLPEDSLLQAGVKRAADDLQKNVLENELSALKAQLNSTAPLIVPVNFGSQDKPERRGAYPGFLLSNDGKNIAYDISMLPFRIGKWNVELDQILRLEVGKTVPTWISMRHENTGNADLRSHLVEVQQATGTLGDPVPFRIVYRDSDQNWFASLCELAIGLHGVEVRCLKREPHATQTPGPSSGTVSQLRHP
jgi:hypothetical protein